MTAPRMETAHAGGCVKRSYESRAKALLDLDRIRLVAHQEHKVSRPGKRQRTIERTRRAHPTLPQRAYVCPSCGCWHLTSQDRQR